MKNEPGADLTGRKVLITRAKHQTESLRGDFERAGAQVFEFATIAIAEPESWHEADQAIKRLTEYDWIFFASANAVDIFFKRFDKIATEYDTIEKRPKVAVIGSATREALTRAGWQSHYMPADFIAESFVLGFPNFPHLNNLQILWPRTNIGRDFILKEFSQAGARVDVVEVYRTVEPDMDDQSRNALQSIFDNNRIDAIALTSSQAARNLASMLAKAFQPTFPQGATVSKVLADTKFVAIGDETAGAVIECFGRCDAVAKPHTREGLVTATRNCLLC